MTGCSLTKYINKVKIVSENRAAIIIEAILKAIAYCHSRDISHR